MIKSSSKLTLAAWEDRPKRVSCMHVHTYDCICVHICLSRGRKNMSVLKPIPPTPILVRLFEISTFYLQDDSDYRHMSMLAGKSLANWRYKMGKSSTFFSAVFSSHVGEQLISSCINHHSPPLSIINHILITGSPFTIGHRH